ncbi:MAG: fibronectin type III domain-containing protein, partial [Acidimicrobiia bacterium]|nr:fibronectin type III domain-containing protein [Acidimicrobiia bacterium]
LAEEPQTRSTGRRVVIVVVTVALVLGLGAAGFILLGGSDADTAGDSTLDEGPGGENESQTPAAEDEAGLVVAGETADDQANQADSQANQAGDGDGRSGDDTCRVVGPLGPLNVDQVTDRAITIGWASTFKPINILLDGSFVDTVPPDTNQYVIEHRPFLPPPLPAGTKFLVEIRTDGEGPSVACATTSEEPPPPGQGLLGVYAPTGLEVVDFTPTSITVGWDLRPGADIHNLFLDGRYVDFGSGYGSTAIADETQFTFLDLEPGTIYEIGIRRVEGPNQSGLTTITAFTATD